MARSSVSSGFSHKPPKKILFKTDCQFCPARQWGIFCSLDDSGASELDTGKATYRYGKGQILFYEGSHAYCLYCVHSGRVKLYKTDSHGQQQIFRIVGAGRILGYRALFADKNYSATAEILEDSVICSLEQNAFLKVLAHHPEVGLNIIKELSKELSTIERRTMALTRSSVRERMAGLILMLKEAYGSPEGKGVHIDLCLSREEMAEMIGVTQESAIRVLSSFKREGLIELHERHVTVLDAERLAKVGHIQI